MTPLYHQVSASESPDKQMDNATSKQIDGFVTLLKVLF